MEKASKHKKRPKPEAEDFLWSFDDVPVTVPDLPKKKKKRERDGENAKPEEIVEEERTGPRSEVTSG